MNHDCSFCGTEMQETDTRALWVACPDCGAEHQIEWTLEGEVWTWTTIRNP